MKGLLHIIYMNSDSAYIYIQIGWIVWLHRKVYLKEKKRIGVTSFSLHKLFIAFVETYKILCHSQYFFVYSFWRNISSSMFHNEYLQKVHTENLPLLYFLGWNFRFFIWMKDFFWKILSMHKSLKKIVLKCLLISPKMLSRVAF